MVSVFPVTVGSFLFWGEKMVKCALCGAEYEGELCPKCGGDVVILDFTPERPHEENNPREQKPFAEKKEEMYLRNIKIAKENGLIIRQKQTAENNLQAKKRNELKKRTKQIKYNNIIGIGAVAVTLCVVILCTAVNIWDNATTIKSAQASKNVGWVEMTQAPKVTEKAAVKQENAEVTDAAAEKTEEQVSKYTPLTAQEDQFYFEDNVISATLEFTGVSPVSDVYEPQTKDNFTSDDYMLFAELTIKNISEEQITVAPRDLLLFSRSWSNGIATPVSTEKYGVPTASEPFELNSCSVRKISLSFICKKEDIYYISALEYFNNGKPCPDMKNLRFETPNGEYMVRESQLAEWGVPENTEQ